MIIVREDVDRRDPSAMQPPTTRVSLTADAATALPISDRLAEGVPDAAVAAFVDEEGSWTVEIHFAEPPEEDAVRALVGSIVGEDAARALAFEAVTAKDWVAASLAGLKPVTAGRFVVHGSHDRAAVPPNRIGIEIEAALAFGTGHHGTTRGCLLALDRTTKHTHVIRAANTPTRSPRRKRVSGRACILDVGTGTGVLAIAAARALRRRVLASDADKRAAVVAGVNARANGAGALVTVTHAAGLGVAPIRRRAPFDLVLANILLGPLKLMARPMRLLLAPHARVMLSGVLPGQANAVLTAYRAQGLRLERRITLDGWATLVLVKGSAKRKLPAQDRPKR